MRVLSHLNIRPHCVLEPTCGQGAFVSAAAEAFPDAKLIVGVDINHTHLAAARKALQTGHPETGARIKLQQGNFFDTDWPKVLRESAGPWLIVGNPPWVTSAELGAIESENLPEKSNFHGRAGIDAITGKSNFDISEWMLLRYLDWLEASEGAFAVLCKTAVARKILLQAWKRRYPIRSARIYGIDALSHFGAAVDACFFVVETTKERGTTSCDVFPSLEAKAPTTTIGFSDGHLIADMNAFERRSGLLGPEAHYIWRSGIKHDCSKVMELIQSPTGYTNGLGEHVNIEDRFLFPMFKSSDIGNGRHHSRGVMLVTQRTIGEDTSIIQREAPRTWAYLKAHQDLFERRGSSIYRNKPPFSIFGVGSYSFSPWKIAISGFYKKLRFLRIGPPARGNPVVFDDTVYLLPCWSEEEAAFLDDLLNSPPATEFYNSMAHWDEKRPITVDLLRRLSIRKLAAELRRESEYARFTARPDGPLFATVKRAAA